MQVSSSNSGGNSGSLQQFFQGLGMAKSNTAEPAGHALKHLGEGAAAEPAGDALKHLGEGATAEPHAGATAEKKAHNDVKSVGKPGQKSTMQLPSDNPTAKSPPSHKAPKYDPWAHTPGQVENNLKAVGNHVKNNLKADAHAAEAIGSGVADVAKDIASIF